MESSEREKPRIKDLNEHIVCPLCRGYLIDATTLVECLHSFCRGCIVRRLSSGARACPACNVATSPPLLPDPRLQRLVYLLVPGLYRSELERRRHFRMVNPQCPPLAQPLGALDLTLDDFVSLSLCELTESYETRNDRAPEDSSGTVNGTAEKKNDESSQGRSTRYLKCPAAVTVRHLVRLLMLKRGWEEANAGVNVVNRIEMMCEEMGKGRSVKELKTLELSWTLLDLACIFGWKREAPMKLYYRILQKEETASISKVSQYNEEPVKDSTSIENIQRPPTPPPSPSPAQEREVEARRVMENGTGDVARAQDETESREKETKTKKPRCEVTPVMRAPESVAHATISSHHATESTKTKELARLEHRKRRKRRNKRVIAEITTTPREDLLKLKVRLTPCPPRITSSAGTGQTKEKLLQMRAVRREKMKITTIAPQRTVNNSREDGNNGGKECNVESEETIEEIIDGIPDEVVRIAQNINTQVEETVTQCTQDKVTDHRSTISANARNQNNKTKDETEATETTKSMTKIATKTVTKPTTKSTEEREIVEQRVRPKKNEELLRLLGLVAIDEANESLREKTKQRAQSGNEKVDSLDREKLEKQLRESKANRVRSLLAEKQMRDALKSIMSKTKEETPSSSSTVTAPSSSSSSSSSSVTSSVTSSTSSVSFSSSSSSSSSLCTSSSITVTSASSNSTSTSCSTSSATTSSTSSTATTTTTTTSSSSAQVTVSPCPKKKGPPPLAPLRVAKPSGTFLSSTTPIQRDNNINHNSKYETPLDLSNGGTVSDNALDLSATLSSTGNVVSSVALSSSLPSSSPSSTISSFSSSSSSPSSSSSSSPSSCPMTSLPFSRPPRAAIAPGNFLRKTGKEFEQRRGQDTNLRTLSDAAVSLLGGCVNDKGNADPLVLGSTSITASKVALRIPQPHQRISGFGMKIKPNLGVRHIPNPQAVVASQYRNQRASYFNAVSQQPP